MDLYFFCSPEKGFIKLIGKIIILSFIFSANHIFAQEKNREIISDMGVIAYYHQYKEKGVMEQTGPFVGMTANLGYKQDNYFGIEGCVAIGLLDYESEQYGTMDTKMDIRFEIKGVTGRIFKPDYKSEILPYTGIILRFFSNDASYKSAENNNIGYNRESTHFYAPFGICYTNAIKNNWDLKVNFEYDYLIYGEHKTFLKSVNGMDDIKHYQKEGYGCRLSFSLIEKTEGGRYEYKLFFVYWDIDDSEIAKDNDGNSSYTPENQTAEIGVNISFPF